MTCEHRPPTRPHADVAIGTALLGYHLLVHERGVRAHRVGYNLATAAGSVAAAMANGATLDELGLGRVAAGRGLAVGLAASVPLVAGIAGAFAIPDSHRVLHDERVEGLSPRGVTFELLVRIPLETALAEEVLFRGVHLGMALRRDSVARAVVASSLAFGLWHVPPARAALERTAAGKHLGGRRGGRHGAVLGTVVSTTVAGAGFAVLRLRSGSIVAPVVVHAAVNGAALASAWLAARRR